MIQVRIFVSGFVQGVGYRAFVMHTASEMNINGWTRNLSDGRVEILAQAPKENIDSFVKKLWEGPMLSEVGDIVVDHEKITEEFTTFEKMPTV